MTNLRIDPHAHTLYSDGTDTPGELMWAAQAARLGVVGITDHDTVDGWAEAEAAVPETGVSLLRGMELSCSADGISVHLLGYLFDPHNPALQAELKLIASSRQNRARQIVHNVSADYPITWEDVLEQAGDAATIGRPHIADALVACGAFSSRNACFDEVLHSRGPYYVPYHAPDPVAAVKLILGAGGVPVLAHPRAAKRGRVLPAKVIHRMAAAGLVGIEVFHRDHNAEQREQALHLAAELDLLVTGGSDYHGTGKDNELGENTLDPLVLAEYERRGTLPVIWA